MVTPRGWSFALSRLWIDCKGTKSGHLEGKKRRTTAQEIEDPIGLVSDEIGLVHSRQVCKEILNAKGNAQVSAELSKCSSKQYRQGSTNVNDHHGSVSDVLDLSFEL